MDLSCHACGTRFRSAIAEARHRHNWPALCKRNKQFERFIAEHYPKEQADAPGVEPAGSSRPG